MGKKSKLVALVAGASLLLGTFGLTACVPENDDKTGNKVPEDIYAIYTAYAETAGEDAMTYDEWYAHLLETAKGDKGDDGKSAYDIWKEQDGNAGKTEAEFLEWLKGGKGDDGKSAYDIWKEQDGNAGKTEAEFLEWLKGDVGPKGEAGTKWFTGEDDEPSADLGAEGDFYLNTKTFDLWTKNKDSGWTKIGCIKGADAGSEESPQYKVVKDFGPMTINTEEVPLDLNEVNNGTYFLVVESDSMAVVNNLMCNLDSKRDYDMYCPLSQSYKSVVLKGDDSTLKLKATQSVTGNVKLVEYSAPTIKADETYEIPLLNRNYGYLPINVESSLIGKKVKVTIHSSLAAVICQSNDKHTSFGSITANAEDKTLYVKEITIPDGMDALCFATSATNCANVTVKIEIVE